MSNSKNATLSYPITDFINAIGNININVFEDEVKSLDISTPAIQVRFRSPQNSIVDITFLNFPTPDDITQKIDPAVIAHIGGLPTTTSQFSQSNTDITTSIDGIDVIVIPTFQTQLLERGKWLPFAFAEIQLDSPAGNARARITWRINGSNFARSFYTLPDQQIFAPTRRSFRVKSGERLTIELLVARIGGSAGTARVKSGAFVAAEFLGE